MPIFVERYIASIDKSHTCRHYYFIGIWIVLSWQMVFLLYTFLYMKTRESHILGHHPCLCDLLVFSETDWLWAVTYNEIVRKKTFSVCRPSAPISRRAGRWGATQTVPVRSVLALCHLFAAQFAAQKEPTKPNCFSLKTNPSQCQNSTKKDSESADSESFLWLRGWDLNHTTSGLWGLRTVRALKSIDWPKHIPTHPSRPKSRQMWAEREVGILVAAIGNSQMDYVVRRLLQSAWIESKPRILECHYTSIPIT